MAEPNPPEKPVAPAEPVSKPPPKAPKKGWSNPALRMLGVPRISLPSRNWMIFWTVLGSLGGGVAYDKYQQSQIRKKWMEEVKVLGEQIYSSDKLPRKLTIYIAPPPNDFLDSSYRIFRKFVKPVLNASALDYDIFTENRQGDIRATVAKKIREMRLAQLEKQKADAEALKQKQYNKSWTKFFKEDVPAFFTRSKKQNDDDDHLVARTELYSAKDVLGLYQYVDTIEPHSEDEFNVQTAGGVICIGRGAYKEYLTGVHEGLLGPLEKPQELIDEEIRVAEEKQKKREEDEKNGVKTSTDDDDDEDVEGGKKKKDPVTKPFITPEQYAAAQLAPELDLSKVVTDDNHIPVLFEQPVYVYPVPNLLGFLTIPRKIYRYYTTRELADDYGHRTTAISFNKIRPFEYKDVFQAKEEELDWPKKWVETGKTKNSEWVQELAVDERVTSRMRVYDHEL
ncbi:uncharacterized protein CANTADRAFT_25069 [Suhomyces tanzawaensis NRRL Y-17324]|uniref:Mitochondrial import inner membrane translocase subunit TIM54 n=1 Tax=Suhomyces tanzawaensis NRRL Y-17324 TaxID=984487 RepID=A0A1E4SMI4_9ASCO|nr:uncharacterized protein CANTADRAFT_25069 [Suhomyces tanzawaensis NRRL Y-17324]ODV80592.1 hypothetical protein CANTADRAFT_25069 [Suhomyces tanzawaensis NRRL Y-17324]